MQLACQSFKSRDLPLNADGSRIVIAMTLIGARTGAESRLCSLRSDFAAETAA